MARTRTVYLEPELDARLREEAAQLGLLVRRGMGAGEYGNLRDLLAVLDAALQRDPEARACLRTWVDQYGREHGDADG